MFRLMRHPVIVQGLGPMGRDIARAVAADPRFELVGAVDPAADVVGRPVGEVLDVALPPTMEVVRSLDLAHGFAPMAEIVLHATSSWLGTVEEQLEDALSLGLGVVSTCEELAWPWRRHPERAERLDRLARDHGCTVVGTGVNPGFLMDRLPVVLAACSHDVRAIRIHRRLDPRPRRSSFRRKIGLGLTRAELEEAGPGFGHVGLRESGEILAHGLGWGDLRWEESVAPAFDGDDVVGLTHTLRGDGGRVELVFEAHTGVTASEDLVAVDGTPPLRLRFDGGVFGDDATVAAVLHAAWVLPRAPRGLISVLDLPLR